MKEETLDIEIPSWKTITKAFKKTAIKNITPNQDKDYTYI